MTMTDQTKRFIGTVVKASAVGTAVSIPVALALRHYVPDAAELGGYRVKPVAISLALTGIEAVAFHFYFRQPRPESLATQLVPSGGV